MSLLERLAAAAGRLAGTRGAVLCYHGIDREDNPSAAAMHVRLEHLESVVVAVRSIARITSLQEIVIRRSAGDSTAGLVALTADDAYESWHAAESYLIREEIPLTIFPVADALRTGLSFWWDRLDDSAARTTTERWRRFEQECGLPQDYRREQPHSEGLTRPLRQWILAAHAGRCPLAVDEALQKLEKELGYRTAQRSMTESELSGFVRRTGAQIGVHTSSHAALPFLSEHDVISEVRKGHEALRTSFPDTLPYLAIPFGLFDARTLPLAENAGMTVSLTLEGQPLDRSAASSIGLPRLCVVRDDRAGFLTLKTSALARLINRVRAGAANPYPVLPSAAS